MHAARPGGSDKSGQGFGASEDGDTGGVGAARRASLFKQRRQVAFHPEIAALPILGGSGKEGLECLNDAVTEHPPTSCGETKGAGESCTFIAPSTGFPVPNHRAVGKYLGRPRVRDDVVEMSTGLIAEDMKNEDDEINAENQRTLHNASPEEIR